MEDNSKEINDLVSKTANVIGCGKKFGGWTDNSTNEAFTKPKDKGQGGRVGRILRGVISAGEPTKPGDDLVRIGPDSSRKETQYTKIIKAGYYPKNENVIGGLLGSYAGKALAGKAVAKMGLSPNIGNLAQWGGEGVGWSIGDRLTNRRKRKQ